MELMLDRKPRGWPLLYLEYMLLRGLLIPPSLDEIGWDSPMTLRELMKVLPAILMSELYMLRFIEFPKLAAEF